MKTNEHETKYKKFQCLGFIDELIQDLESDNQKIVIHQRDFNKKTLNKTITDELKKYNLFTKREIESYSLILTKIKDK